MNIYIEQSSVNKNQNSDKTLKIILRVFQYIFAIAGALLIIFASLPIFSQEQALNSMLEFSIIIVSALCCILFAVFLRRFRLKLKPEYDYILTSTVFKIIKVTNSTNRKKMLEIPLHNISTMGKYSSDSYKRFALDPQVKKIIATANMDIKNEIYYMIYTQGGRKTLLHFEPKEDLLNGFRLAFGRDLVNRN